MEAFYDSIVEVRRLIAWEFYTKALQGNPYIFNLVILK